MTTSGSQRLYQRLLSQVVSSKPLWPGQPISAHWGVEDPVSVEGTSEEKEKAFSNVFLILNRRISLFTSLPMATLDRISLHREVKNIGQS